MELALIVTLIALLASAVAAKTCEEQKAHCDELNREEESHFQRLVPENTTTPLWPVTAADLKQLQAPADQYCRWNADLANCRKSLYAQCPALYKDDAESTGGWYNAEFRLSLSALCSTTVGPVKFVRAIRHCIEKDEDVLEECCDNLDTPSHNEENDSASVAHQNFCNKLKMAVSYFDEGAQDVAKTCGQDTHETFKDAFKQIQTAYCKK